MVRCLFKMSVVFAIWGSGALAQTAPVPNQCVTTALAGGTGDAITIPRLPCVPTTTLLILVASSPNTTTTPTLQPVGTTALPIVNADGSQLAQGVLKTGSYTLMTSNGQKWYLLAPTSSVITGPGSPSDNNWLAKWLPGGSLGSAYSASNNGNLVGSFHQSALGPWGNHVFHAGSTGLVNNAVFSLLENYSGTAFAFPTALTGYADMVSPSVGNQDFGIYGVVEQYTTTGTSAAAEFTARNMVGPGNDTSLPPDNAIPNSHVSTKGVNITCGSQGLGDCSIGLHITNENGIASSPVFNTAEYIMDYRQFGIFIGNMPTGIQTGEVIQTNGNGWALQLQAVSTPSLGSPIMVVTNPSNATVFSIAYNGAVHSSSQYFVGSPEFAGVSCTGTPTSSFASVGGIVTHC